MVWHPVKAATFRRHRKKKSRPDGIPRGTRPGRLTRQRASRPSRAALYL